MDPSRSELQEASAAGSSYQQHHAVFHRLAEKCARESRFEHEAAIRHYLAQLAENHKQPPNLVAQLRRDALRVELRFRQHLQPALWPTAAELEIELDVLVRETDAQRERLKTARGKAKQDLPDPSLVSAATLPQLQDAMREQFGVIREFLLSFFRDLVSACVAECGPPPCQLALIGLGSLARDECTLHSDLECCILLAESLSHEGKAYFRRLTRLLLLKLLRLGETVLPSLAIPELNGEDLPASAWRFFDEVTRRGLGLDGFMAGACKTPLGNGHLYSSMEDARAHGHALFELIHTPEEMVECFFRGPDAQSAGKLSPALARHHAVLQDILLTFCPVWATPDGDQLPERYRALLEQYRHQNPASSVRQCLRTLRLDAERFQETFTTAAGTPLAVKPELYRLLERVVCGVAAVHQLPLRLVDSSSLQRISDLAKAGVLDAAGVSNLRFAVCTAMYLRLRMYLLADRALDVLGVLTARELTEQHHVIPPAWIHDGDSSPLFTLFETITAVADAVANFTLHEGTEPQWLKPADGFRGRPHVRNAVRMRLMQHHVVFEQDPLGAFAADFLRRYAVDVPGQIFDAVEYLDGQLHLLQWADSAILAGRAQSVLPVLEKAVQLQERVMQLLHGVRTKTKRLTTAYAAEQMALVQRNRLAQLHHSLGVAHFHVGSGEGSSSAGADHLSSGHRHLVRAASLYTALGASLPSAKSLSMLALVEDARGEALLKQEAEFRRKWHYQNAHRWFALARDAFRQAAAGQGATSLADELSLDQNEAAVFAHEGRPLEQRALLQRSIAALRSCFRQQPHPIVASLLHQMATTFHASQQVVGGAAEQLHAHEQTNRYVAEALAMLAKLDNNPMCVQVQFNCLSLRGNCWLDRGKFDDARSDFAAALKLAQVSKQASWESQAEENLRRLRRLSGDVADAGPVELELLVDDAVANEKWSQAVVFTQLLIKRAQDDGTRLRLLRELTRYKQRSNVQLSAYSSSMLDETRSRVEMLMLVSKYGYAAVLSSALDPGADPQSSDPLMHHSYHLLCAEPARPLEAVGVLAAALATPGQRGGRCTRQLYRTMAIAETMAVREARNSLDNRQTDDALYGTALSDVLYWRKSLFELRARVSAVVFSPMRGPVPESALVGRALRLCGTWLRDWMASAVARCIGQLNRSACMPPSFELISFGSVARGEATPYSDVEFGILVPEGTTPVQYEWLRQMATLLHMQCLYMLETPLTDLALETDTQGKSALAASRFNVKGFSFDGRMRQACKTPLGNAHVKNASFRFELIQTPRAMAQYTSAATFARAPHLVSTLSVADSLYLHGPVPGPTPSLLSQYRACCGEQAATEESRVARVRQLLLMDLARHEPFGAQKCEDAGGSSSTLSLKYTSLRLLTLAMQHLAMLYLPASDRPSSTAGVIAALHAAGHLSREWKEELEWLLTQQLQLRLQHHALTYGMKDTARFSEDDELATVAQLAGSRVYRQGHIATLYIAHLRFYDTLKRFWLQLQTPDPQATAVFLAPLPSLHRFTSAALSDLSPSFRTEALRQELMAICWDEKAAAVFPVQSVPRWLATESAFAVHLDDKDVQQFVMTLLIGLAASSTVSANCLASRWQAVLAQRASAASGGSSAPPAPVQVQWDSSLPASREDQHLRAQIFLTNGEPRKALDVLEAMPSSPWPLDEVRRANEEARAHLDFARHPLVPINKRNPALDCAAVSVAKAQSILKPLHLQETRLWTDGLHQLAGVLNERGDVSGAAEQLRRIVELDSRIYGPLALQLADTYAQLAEREPDLQQARRWLQYARGIYETQGRLLGQPFTQKFVALRTKSGNLDLKEARALVPQGTSATAAGTAAVNKARSLLQSARKAFTGAIKLADTDMPACATVKSSAESNLHACKILLARPPFVVAIPPAACASASLPVSVAASSSAATTQPTLGDVHGMYFRAQSARHAGLPDDAERGFRDVVTVLAANDPTNALYPKALDALAATLVTRANRAAVSMSLEREACKLAEEALGFAREATLRHDTSSRLNNAQTICVCLAVLTKYHEEYRDQLVDALATFEQLGGITDQLSGPG